MIELPSPSTDGFHVRSSSFATRAVLVIGVKQRTIFGGKESIGRENPKRCSDDKSDCGTSCRVLCGEGTLAAKEIVCTLL